MIGHHRINFDQFIMVFNCRVAPLFMLRWPIFFLIAVQCCVAGIKIRQVRNEYSALAIKNIFKKLYLFAVVGSELKKNDG